MTTWREKFLSWVRSQLLPSGDGRLVLSDAELLPAGLSVVLSSRGGTLLLVTSDSSRLEAVAAALEHFHRLLEEERPIIALPEVALSRHQWVPENEAGRCAALEMILSRQPAVYVTTPQVLLSEAIAPESFQEQTFTLHVGDHVDLEELAKRLVALDYDHEFEVHQPGEFARRGGIVDIYSPLHDAPVRLEFWGDEIERMRFFYPDSQRSFAEVSALRVVPRGTAVLTASDDSGSTVLDYFLSDTPLVLCEPQAIDDHLVTFGSEDLPEKWQATVEKQSVTAAVISVGDAGQENTWAPPAAAAWLHHLSARSLATELAELLPELGDGAALWHWQQLCQQLARWTKDGFTVVACCSGAGEAERFREMLQEDDKTRHLPIGIEEWELGRGLFLAEQRLVLLSDRELFGRKAPVRRRRHVDYRLDQALQEAAELEDGELAVHAAHGICRYHGVRFLESGPEMQEVVELEFADDARLYVPLDQIYLLSRYFGAGRNAPSLSKIGGVAWRHARENATAAAQDLAAELLQLEARRQQALGVRFRPQIEWERSFANAFPYTETADQAEAIQAVLRDMEDDKPMDRLLCGDVGYGKTEVAMRAAFRAVLNGRQVAVLVPTTVLAQQHFQTFRERMAEYPITVEMLSRFRTAAAQKDILRRLAQGEIDILIGTHRILQRDVEFAQLGLLVIDEEQRFGVRHKQRLKSMRANVDILTMTATPIPRTLYFSLSGIRNLSTIMTAPDERMPVTTVAANFDRELIRQALTRELARGGQAFFLYNRVRTIDKMADLVSGLVPAARCAIAHGQMGAGQLENVMAKFVRQEIDILICTTIIESGVDIPNVNTIIIDRADRFGLAELYQLRGRVGRYHRQAYAYLLLPPMGQLPENARQRLAAIRRYAHLGAGFQLALRDLEIRGAGNILGAEQSGHIAAVGFELYCQLLREAVEGMEQKQLQRPQLAEVHFDRLASALETVTGLTAMSIPASYVSEESVRVGFYKRLSQMAKAEEVESLRLELRDRFGELPDNTATLLEYALVRAMATERNIIRLIVREQRLILETPSGLWRDGQNQVPKLASNDGRQQLRQTRQILTGIQR